MQKELLQAIDFARAGQWNAAHEMVQQHETNATAAWIHAVLHKMEGDHDNSRHWYCRAGRLEHCLVERLAVAVRAKPDGCS
jgi:hypothetical protein